MAFKLQLEEEKRGYGGDFTVATPETIVDFDGSGDYTLVQNGLVIKLPEVVRQEVGDPSVSARRVQDRVYGNREIEITFNIDAANDDTLRQDIQKINRVLEGAVHRGRTGVGPRIMLAYQLENASKEVIFDVIDGELNLGNIASPTVRRGSKLLGAKLTLICEPFARDRDPIEHINYLTNPGFDWNPGEDGRTGSRRVTFGPTNVRLETTEAASNFAPTGNPPRMCVGAWVNRASDGGTHEIVVCGNTTLAWRFLINSSDVLEFVWNDGSDHTVTGASVTDADGWVFVWAVMFSTDGTDVVAVIGKNDQALGLLRLASPSAMTTPAGVFSVGARSDNTERFDGDMKGLFVLKEIDIMPNMMLSIWRYGIRALINDDAFFGADGYWSVEDSRTGGIWEMDETAAPYDDLGISDRVLVVPGGATAPANNADLRKPATGTGDALTEPWQMGSDFLSDGDSGLVESRKHGQNALLFFGTGAANFHIEQTVQFIAGTSQCEVVIWVRPLSPAVDARITVELVEEAITDEILISSGSVGGWRQYARRYAISSTTNTLRLKHTNGGQLTGIIIDSAQFLRNDPYELSTTMTQIAGTGLTADPIPYFGSYFNQNIPAPTGGNGRVPWLEVEDMPGDAPALCRFYIENESGNELGPVRAVYSPKQVSGQHLYWQMSNFVPDFAAGSTLQTGRILADASEATLVDRMSVPLTTLFLQPFLQYGSHKVFVALEGENGLVTIAQIETPSAKVPLGTDPIKFPNVATAATEIGVVDLGILTWPPSLPVDVWLESRMRGSQRGPEGNELSLLPRLIISNIADVDIADIDHLWLILMPVDGSYATLWPASDTADAFLRNQETMVVDTIDPRAAQYGYIQKELSGQAYFQQAVSLAAVNAPIYTTGFYIEPKVPGFFQVLAPTRHGATQFGNLGVGGVQKFELWVSYIPRYLFV